MTHKSKGIGWLARKSEDLKGNKSILEHIAE